MRCVSSCGIGHRAIDLPALGLVTTLAILAACTRDTSSATAAASSGGGAARYTLVAVERTAVPSVVKLPGRLAAMQEIGIYPKVSGYVKDVFVDIGSRVSAGSRLLTLEAPELVQAALQAKERHARAVADYVVDREHLARFLEANKTKGAVSPLELSTLRAKAEADSALANAEQANWQMQEAMLGYLTVTAPFAGVITDRAIHPGALVTTSSHDHPILELKEIDRLRLQVDVPEELASQLRPRDSVTFTVSGFPGRRVVGHLTRRSRNIGSQILAERAEVDVDNRAGELSPGMYAEVLLYVKGAASAFSVPATAVVTSTERRYVLLVRNGRTAMIDVVTGNATKDRVEIYGALAAGDSVVSNASAEIPEGAPVR